MLILCAFLRRSFLKHLQISDGQVLARSYLMLYVIFPIYMNFPITSRWVLKATIHRKKNSELFYLTWESLLLEKVLHYLRRCFYDIVHLDLSIFFRFLYLSFINYFCHITFYTRNSLSVFIRDFPCSSFPLILQISGRTYCYFKLNEKMVHL